MFELNIYFIAIGTCFNYYCRRQVSFLGHVTFLPRKKVKQTFDGRHKNVIRFVFNDRKNNNNVWYL